MIRRPPRSTQSRSSAASDVYKRTGEQPTIQRRRGGQPGSPLLPGGDHLGGVGGDRQPSAHPARLVVVIDQVVLAVDDLDAADSQADHFAGASPGVAQLSL